MAEAGRRGGGGGIRACNQSCGCAVPCPGGNACRCATAKVETAGGDAAHRWCPCGEHCGCNPCTCPSAVAGVGKDFCKCGENCRCETCGAGSG
ncbi:metallothionein-like protein 4A [Momordica charantia]|uniref:Metallothionein-like protein 4A n=1 Tax=Momordica charantia TaxID=3673 RepID=A0A6J1CGB3_MOMCH|nr:metallothionein-like protein 4A [Momordica charantia]